MKTSSLNSEIKTLKRPSLTSRKSSPSNRPKSSKWERINSTSGDTHLKRSSIVHLPSQTSTAPEVKAVTNKIKSTQNSSKIYKRKTISSDKTICSLNKNSKPTSTKNSLSAMASPHIVGLVNPSTIEEDHNSMGWVYTKN